MTARPLFVLAVLLLAVPGAIARAPSIAVPTGFQPTSNGNFSIAGPGPETTLPAASVLSVSFELRDLNYTPALKGLYVRVPAPTAQFNVSYGDLRITLRGTTVVFNSTNWTNPANTTSSVQLLNQTVFPNTGRVSNDRAVLASGDLALTSPAPFGSLTVELRWHWAAAPSFGANFTGAWEPSAAGTAIQPDQFVPIQSSTVQSVSPGQGVQVCLGGPVAGRTFDLHAVMSSPRLDFASVNATVPATGSPPACLVLTLPSWLEPQTINVYVWDFYTPPGNATNITSFLLYVVKVNVVPPTTPPPALYGVPFPYWYGAGLAAAGIVVVGGVWGYRQEWGKWVRPRGGSEKPGIGGSRPEAATVPKSDDESVQPPSS